MVVKEWVSDVMVIIDDDDDGQSKKHLRLKGFFQCKPKFDALLSDLTHDVTPKGYLYASIEQNHLLLYYINLKNPLY